MPGVSEKIQQLRYNHYNAKAESLANQIIEYLSKPSPGPSSKFSSTYTKDFFSPNKNFEKFKQKYERSLLDFYEKEKQTRRAERESRLNETISRISRNSEVKKRTVSKERVLRTHSVIQNRLEELEIDDKLEDFNKKIHRSTENCARYLKHKVESIKNIRHRRKHKEQKKTQGGEGKTKQRIKHKEEKERQGTEGNTKTGRTQGIEGNTTLGEYTESKETQGEGKTKRRKDKEKEAHEIEESHEREEHIRNNYISTNTNKRKQGKWKMTEISLQPNRTSVQV